MGLPAGSWLGGALAVLLLAALLASSCTHAGERTLVVTATAYNSLPGQTEGDPTRGAWGDVLAPGMKAIAVSPDLEKLGLTRGVRVRIEGLPGTYTVLDRMPRRWKRKIDIYMGRDVEAARAWGRRSVKIHWTAD